MNAVDFLRALVKALADREPDSEHIAQLQQRAQQAEADRDRFEAQARGWKARFEAAITERDNETSRAEAAKADLAEALDAENEWKGWEAKARARAEEAEAEVEVKDQRIADVEHVAEELDADLATMGEKFERARADGDNETARAERAEAELGTAAYWRDRAERAEDQTRRLSENSTANLRISEKYQDAAQAQRAEEAKDTAVSLMLQATTRAKTTENRAAAWWETAKTLCRQRDVCNNVASEGWYRAFEYRQRAESAESAASQWGTSVLHERRRANAAENRAATWWEIAKAMCRERNDWKATADWRFGALCRLRAETTEKAR